MKKQGVEKSVQITLIISATILVLGLLSLSLIGKVIPDLQNKVSVDGNSELDVVPDTVSVYLTISELENSSKNAKDAADEVYEEVLVDLILAGLEKNDIKTTNYNIVEDYEWVNQNRKFRGYRANHNLKISFSADKSDLISDVLNAGINNGASFSHINFEISQELENDYKAQALLLATKDAKSKAEAVAEGLDKDLGKLVSISTNDFYYQPWRAYDNVLGMEVKAEAIESSMTEIIPNTRQVTARVSVVYKLK